MISLYRKAWAAFPQDHYYFITYVKRDEIWQMPEIYDYRSRGHHSQGPFIGRVHALVTVLSHQYSLPTAVTCRNPRQRSWPTSPPSEARSMSWRTRSPRLVGKLPNWTAGDALLAFVLCRAGKFAEAESLIRKLPEIIKKDPVAASGAALIYAYHAIGLELEQHSATRDLAIEVYENALNTPYSYLQIRFEPRTDGRSATWLTCIDETGGSRTRDARCSTWFVICKFPDAMLQEAADRFRMQHLVVVADELVGLGFTADAVPLLSEAATLADLPNPNTLRSRSRSRTCFQSPAQVRQRLDSAVERLSGISSWPRLPAT